MTEYNKNRNDAILSYVEALRRLEKIGFFKSLGII